MQKVTFYNSKSSILGSLSCTCQRTSNVSYLPCPLYIFLSCWNIPKQPLMAAPQALHCMTQAATDGMDC